MFDTVAETEAVVARAGEVFAGDAPRGTVNVLLDQGLYRHLQVTNHEGLTVWFEVVTWPGGLTLHGAPGTFTFMFPPVKDMLESLNMENETSYFREEPMEARVRRWAAVLASRSTPAFVYAGKGRAGRYLREAVKAAEDQFPDLGPEVEATFFSSYASADMDTEDGFRASAAAFEHDDFRFLVKDWNLKIVDFRFAYACHCLVWAVEQWYARQPVNAAV